MSLTPDQRRGAQFLARSSIAMLADVPGLGKTAQVVRACDMLIARSATVLVPSQTLALNFAREFDKWSLLGHTVHILKTSKQDIPSDGVLITTYALATRPEVARRLARRKIDVLVCDEAHALKERSAQRAKVVLRKKGILGVAARTWLLTGTPAPNNSSELYVFARLTGAFAGSFNQFAEQYCELFEGAFGVQIVGSKNHAALKALLAPWIMRRTHVEGRPALTVDQRYVEASSAIDPYAKLAPADLEAVKLAIESGNWTLADIPAVATVRRAVGMAKADGVAELANAELDAGFKKLLVFAWHTDVIDRLASLIPGAVVYDGRTSNSRKDEIVKAFQGDGGPRVIIAQTVAAGTGLTLTKANRVIIAEPAWTPDNNEQAIARAWRKGQQEPVLASFVGLRGSLDERITAALHRKSEDVSKIL